MLELILWSFGHAVQTQGFDTEETCTQYNVLKVARYLFRWTGSAVLADILGTQRLPASYQAKQYADTHTGGAIDNDASTLSFEQNPRQGMHRRRALHQTR